VGKDRAIFWLVKTGPLKTVAHKMDLPNFAGQRFAIYKLTEKSFRAEAGPCDGRNLLRD
jgi:hypothetical protein